MRNQKDTTPTIGWMSVGHVRDSVLAAAALAELNDDPQAVGAWTRRHLTRCAQCQARVRELRAVLAGDRAMAIETADATWTDARLADQRDAIIARLAQKVERGHARILAFPTPPAGAAAQSRRDRPAVRWLAAAAAAGLLVGVSAGQVILPAHRQWSSVPRISATRSFTPISVVSPSGPNGTNGTKLDRVAPGTDEAFLSEMEIALNRRRIPALRALDDLTPRNAELVKARNNRK